MAHIPIWDKAWQLGIQSNLIASAIAAFAAGLVGYVKIWRKHMLPHIERTRQLHRHMDPNDPFHIGDE